jgi:rSAM/selenodomain-associated transferase 2
LSVVVPARNEARSIERCLAPLQSWRARGVEVIVVDGGSGDDTVAHAQPLADRVCRHAPGRAAQMNAGAACASGGLLLFLHADTWLEDTAIQALQALPRGHVWGRFDVRLRSRHPVLRLVAAAMNLRSRATGIATGDQCQFVSRSLFARVGGFPAQPLMEDVEISRRLLGQVRPVCLRQRVSVSARRWRQRGIFRTIVLMWWLRWRYWRGDDPAALHRIYYP